MEHGEHKDEDVQLVDAVRGDEGHLSLHVWKQEALLISSHGSITKQLN